MRAEDRLVDIHVHVLRHVDVVTVARGAGGRVAFGDADDLRLRRRGGGHEGDPLEIIERDAAADRPAAKPDRPPEPEEEPPLPGSLHDSTLEVAAMYLWVVGVRKEKRYDIAHSGGEARPDIHSGSGLGLRAGVAVSDNVSVGPLYLFSRHDEETFDRGLDIHAVYIEALFGGPLSDNAIQPTAHFGIGAGGYAIDFDEGFEDSGGMAFEVRLLFGAQFAESLQVCASAAYHIMGILDTCANDGETHFQGGFVSFEVAYHF